MYAVKCDEELNARQPLLKIAVEGKVLAVDECLDVWRDIIHPPGWIRRDLFSKAAEAYHVRACGGDIFGGEGAHVWNWVGRDVGD